MSENEYKKALFAVRDALVLFIKNHDADLLTRVRDFIAEDKAKRRKDVRAIVQGLGKLPQDISNEFEAMFA